METQTILTPGTEAPDYKLRGPGGATYTLSEHRGECAVLLVFFPFAFSSTCSHQLPDVQKAMAKLEAANVVVYGISVDSYHANAAFASSLPLTCSTNAASSTSTPRPSRSQSEPSCSWDPNNPERRRCS